MQGNRFMLTCLIVYFTQNSTSVYFIWCGKRSDIVLLKEMIVCLTDYFSPISVSVHYFGCGDTPFKRVAANIEFPIWLIAFETLSIESSREKEFIENCHSIVIFYRSKWIISEKRNFPELKVESGNGIKMLVLRQHLKTYQNFWLKVSSWIYSRHSDLCENWTV